MPTLEHRAHANLCGWVRFLARLDRGELLDKAGVVASRGPTDFPGSRAAVRSESPESADVFVATLDRFFFADGKTACSWIRIDEDDDLHAALQARGFQEFAQTPEMVCEHPLEARDPPAGVTVRLASTAEDVSAYARIAGEAFTHLALPAEITAATIDNPSVMLGSEVVIALADLDGEPVAGACVVMVGPGPIQNGYVGWVSCLDQARGIGLGDVVTRRVTNEAFALGASIVSLEASHFGEHTYARMGYRELYRYRLMIKI